MRELLVAVIKEFLHKAATSSITFAFIILYRFAEGLCDEDCHRSS